MGGVAFVATDDPGFGQALLGPPVSIGASACVVAQAAENEDVEGVVDGAVNAAIESVSVRSATTGRDRSGSAKVRTQPRNIAALGCRRQ